MMKYIILLGSLLFLCSSCNTIQDPTLISVKNVKVIQMNKDMINLNADMVINNPNAFSLDLANTDMTASVDGIVLAEIKQNYDTTMPANADFNMPVNIKMDIKKLYSDDPLLALSKGLKIASEKKLEVKFQGNIYVGKGAAKVSVPIDEIEMVNF